MQHQKSNNHGTVQTCSQCDFASLWPNSLQRHVREVHGAPRARNHLCELCGLSFQDLSSLSYHARVHDDKREFACISCDKRFVLRGHLSVHMAVVHKNAGKLFECTECDQKYPFLYMLKSHQKIVHRNERPFKCPHCEMPFPRTCDVLRHVRSVHEGRHDYNCDVCNKTFKGRTGLMLHRENQHGIPRSSTLVTCEKCLKTFSNESTLATHTKQYHDNNTTYPCPSCAAVHKCAKALKRHCSIMHGSSSLGF